MSKQEEEYYWAVERKKVLLMWLCLFCKIVCIASVFGESAVNSMLMAQGRWGVWAPTDSPSAADIDSWPRSLVYVHWRILFTVNLNSLYMLNDGNLCSSLNHVLDLVCRFVLVYTRYPHRAPCLPLRSPCVARGFERDIVTEWKSIYMYLAWYLRALEQVRGRKNPRNGSRKGTAAPLHS